MANYLEREAKAKKEARKEKNSKGRTTIEKMDSTLEEIMKESNLEGKIKELEEALKKAQEVEQSAKEKAEEVRKDTTQRNENGQAKFDEYKKEIIGEHTKAEQESMDIDKKLKFYKAFKENGKQILNIREYQIELQKRLGILETQNRNYTLIQKAIEATDNEISRLEEGLQKLQEDKREVDTKLKSSDISDEDRAKLEVEKAKIENKINTNNIQYTKIKVKNDAYRSIEMKDGENVENEIVATKTKISKCNMIWTSLLKGKNWDEIEVILANGDFKGKKGTIDKIRDLSKAKEEQSNEVDLSEVQKQTGRDVSQILDGVDIENDENGEEEEELEQEEKSGLPSEVKTFAERHPRLARIPGLARIMDRRDERKREKAEENRLDETEEPEQEAEAESESKTEQESYTDKDLKYIDKQMEKGREAEMFKTVADKGIRETVKVDRETQYKLMKVSAAKAQAEKFAQHDKSGRYQEQLKTEEENAKQEEER